LTGGQASFSPAQARQIASVLRLRVGDLVSVFDGAGREWTARLTVATPCHAHALLLEERPRAAGSRLRITLAQVVVRGSAMDLIVAKATELGVSRISPLEAEHSVRREPAAGREARWRRIVAEAAEQCGRRCIPELDPTRALGSFLSERPADQSLWVCDFATDAVPLTRMCGMEPAPPALAVLIGGEGGLSPDEVALATAHGGRLVSLGPRLLRAETAALAALAVLQACLGDWGETVRSA
jgi:16S rRNA (uracil1498-N3)-methyltransferase